VNCADAEFRTSFYSQQGAPGTQQAAPGAQHSETLLVLAANKAPEAVTRATAMMAMIFFMGFFPF
jgi:hypothetical protein